MKLFYHDDLDGKCSAAIAKLVINDDNLKLFQYNYGNKTPKINDNEKLFILDCSFDIEQMVYYSSFCDVIWIDHHISSIKKSKEYNFNPNGIRNIKYSASELTWKYFNSDKKIPLSIKMIGSDDLGDFYKYKDLQAFIYGLNSFDLDPRKEEGMNIWRKLIHTNYHNEVISFGKHIERYNYYHYNKIIKSYSFNTYIEGKKAIAVNRPFSNSLLFESLKDKEKFDIMILFSLFSYNKVFKWKVSLFSNKDNIDVSKIAEKYNGGGHKSAAGFICDKLPFRIENQI